MEMELTADDNGITDFVFAGNLGNGQCLDVIVNAAAELGSRYDYKIHMVGDGSMRAKLELMVKEKLGCKGLRYVSGGKPVRTVAVGGGSCADFMQAALKAGCDTVVTADVKYNQFRTAHELGLNLIDAGHFHTENPVMPVVAEKLRAAFPGVEVIFSENHTDAMNFFV